ncbi:MAG: 50S ribosomal protein L6, partial [Clostridiaceae bacterium]
DAKRHMVDVPIVGTTNGFEKKHEIVGVGYKVQPQGTGLLINVGYTHPVKFPETSCISFDVPAPTKITVKGINKQVVGQVAADIRAVRPPEPYKGKGIRYENEVVRRKEGKTGK